MVFSPKNLGVIVCKHVRDRKREILFISHSEDGDWSFTCGEFDHSSDPDADDEYTLVGVGHLVDADNSIDEASTLPKGWSAERKKTGDPWHRLRDDQ